MKIPFIVLTQGQSNKGKIIIQIEKIIAFGHLMGDINNPKSFVYISVDPKPRDRMQVDDGCFTVMETPEKIMAMIDKAQALVYAMEQ